MANSANYTQLLPEKERLNKRFIGFRKDRSQFDSHVRKVYENLLPRLSRFHHAERNRGGERNQNIIDSEGTRALRVLAAGMMAGMTSPARPWFKLSIADKDLAKHHTVKLWLAEFTDQVRRVFRKSNTYNMLHSSYRELGGAGTAAVITEDNFERVIHHSTMTFGEYYLGFDHENQLSSMGREFEMNVEQVASWFGLDNLSQTARNAYDNGNYEHDIILRHLIEPNVDRDPTKRDPRNMRFKSIYYEVGREGQIDRTNGFLKRGGYREFPGIGPRWDVLYNDTYGSSPGMEALGDLMQLQQEQFSKSKGIDYMADPPIQAPTAMRNAGADFLPGGVSYYDSSSPYNGVRTAFDVKLDLQYLLQDIGEVKERINAAFYADMFLMLAQADRTNMTATEVAERHEEKLLMLGPVLERLHNELLDPLVTRTASRLIEAGAVPPPPPELEEAELEIEYVSMLAQAQRAVGTNATDRFMGHVGVIAQMKPDVVDKIDADASVERYADDLGIDPDIIVPGDKVALIRQKRAEAEAQAAAAEQADKLAGAANKVGNIPTGDETQAETC